MIYCFNYLCFVDKHNIINHQYTLYVSVFMAKHMYMCMLALEKYLLNQYYTMLYIHS